MVTDNKTWCRRHLCEFTGLDIEMEINEHYMEVLEGSEYYWLCCFILDYCFDLAVFGATASMY